MHQDTLHNIIKRIWSTIDKAEDLDIFGPSGYTTLKTGMILLSVHDFRNSSRNPLCALSFKEEAILSF